MAHVGIWLGDWPGFILMLVVPALIIGLAALKSRWFLLLLLVPPLPNNVPRFVAGVVTPLLFRSERMDIVLEENRIGYLIGQDRFWLPLEEIQRVERFADVWTIVSPAASIYIPVSAIDETHMTRVRATARKGS